MKNKRQGSLKLDLQLFAGNRTAEIEERKAEIRVLLEGESEVDLDALQKELRELDEEKQKIEKRKAIAAGIEAGTIEGRSRGTLPAPGHVEPEKRKLPWNEAIAEKEYRDAWAKDMMNVALKPEEREMYDRVNVEYRDFTHTTENTQVLIPKTVADGIWRRAEEAYPLWADVRKLRVTGELSMKKSSGESQKARWYDEQTKVDTDPLGFGVLNLTGCELSKAIEVTWKLRKMAVNDFVDYIEREIADRMGAALSYGVYSGRGKPGAGETFKPEPRGIKTVLEAEAGTPQIIEYTAADGLLYTNLTGGMAGIHSSYANGAAIYANSLTIWNVLANLVDKMGRPMFVPDVSAGGVGRIFGLSIKPDASIPVGELLIGNLQSGYLANINEDITMYREEHIRERLTDYMGYAIVDGDVVDSKAFVIIQVAVAGA